MTDESEPLNEEKTGFDDKDIDFNDDNINQLVKRGLKSFYLTKYDEATETLSEACELFVEKFQQEDPMLLYYYGNSLYRLAVSTSDVLGGEGEAGEKKLEDREEEEEPVKGKNPLFKFAEQQDGQQEGEVGASEKEQVADDGALGDVLAENAPADDSTANNTSPDNSSADRDSADQDPADDTPPDDTDDSDQTDFEISWQVLDLARTLFIKKIQENNEKSNDNPQKSEIDRKLNVQLADTYDLLGEVSLESENFNQAVQDLTSALDLKNKLYDSSSSLISEAYFKLSLAHELDSESPNHIDKAIDHLEKTIQCVQNREKTATNTSDDNSEILNDLKIKLDELKQMKITDNEEKTKVIQGILGENAIKDGLLATLSNQANDISGLVKKRKLTNEESSNNKKQAK